MLELVALGTDRDAAVAAASELGGRVYVRHETEQGDRPYDTLVRVVTDRPDAVAPAAAVALHVVFARVIKAPAGAHPPRRAIGSFPLRHHPDLNHRQADDHWRDTHAPLALTHHAAMCDYEQLSIVHTVHGPELDGIALCAFADRDDLRHRFFNDDEARAAIEADVAAFADVRRSPRRVVLSELT